MPSLLLACRLTCLAFLRVRLPEVSCFGLAALLQIHIRSVTQAPMSEQLLLKVLFRLCRFGRNSLLKADFS